MSVAQMALLDDLLRLFGTSRTRLRWKWDNWKKGMNRTVEDAKDRMKPSEVAYVPRHKAGWRRWVEWAIPEEFPVVTVANIAFVVGLYFVMVKATHDAVLPDAESPPGFTPGPVQLVRYGAQWGWLLLERGEWWRSITAIFLHLGVLHLIMNVVSLWVAGQSVEELFGRPRTLVLWLVTGVAGFLFSFWFHGPGDFTAGASGSIFGLIGAVVGHVVRYRGRSTQFLKERFVPWLIYGVIFSFVPGINALAHFGGLISGFLCGLLLADKRQGRRAPDWVWNIAALVCVAIIFGAFWLAYRSTGANLMAEVLARVQEDR